MHKATFKKKIYVLSLQTLAITVLASTNMTLAYATLLHANGDWTSNIPIDLSNEGITRIETDKETTGLQVYTNTAYTLAKPNGATEPSIFVRAGSTFKLNTSDISGKTGSDILTVVGHTPETAAIWIGSELPPYEKDIETSKETVFQGQYLNIIQKEGTAIHGNGSPDSNGGSALTTFELKNSSISALEGIVWIDYGTTSKLNLDDVSLNTGNSGIYIASSAEGNTTLTARNLDITTGEEVSGGNIAVGLTLNGEGLTATLDNTTISGKTSALSIRGAQAHFTGDTKISSQDSTRGGQFGIRTSDASTVLTIDHLELDYLSKYNGAYGGGIVASNNSKVFIGTLGQNRRSKIKVFTIENANPYYETLGINAISGEITLNSVDLVNFRPGVNGEEISKSVIGIQTSYRGNVTLNDSTVIIKDTDDDPFFSNTVGANLNANTQLTLTQGSHIEAGRFAVKMAKKSALTMRDSSLAATISAIYASPSVGTQQEIGVHASIDNSRITALQKNLTDPFGTALTVGSERLTDAAHLDIEAKNGSVINANYLYKVQRGTLTLNADNSTLYGAARIAAPYTVGGLKNSADVTLTNGSVWHLNKDPDTFQPTEPDYVHVNNLVLDHSEIRFSKPKSLQDFQQFAVGTLHGTNGVIELWTELNNDQSGSDQLLIRDQATGTTFLRIKRFDDKSNDGAQTNVGIKVVSADSGTATNTATTADNAFILDSGSTGYRAGTTPSLAAGLYDYYLVKGGKGGESESWYLNSKATPIIDPDPIDPDPVDPDPVDPIKPTTYRPEIDAYFANRQMAVATQRHRWQERISSQASGSRAWGRTAHQEDRFTNQFGYKRKMESTTLHFGADVWQTTFSDLSKLSVGAMVLFSDGKSKTRNEHLTAEGKVKGYNLGVYATWQQNPDSDVGVYVDSWLMQGWFRNKVKGEGLNAEKYNSRNISASLEGGYGFVLSETESTRYYLQPQAQVIWSHFNANDVYEQTRTRIHEQGKSFTSYRLGLRFKADIAQENGTQLAPFAELNYWRHPSSSRMSFNERSAKDITPKNVFATTVGMQAQLSKSTSISGRFSYMMGNEKYRDSNVQLGVNYAW
ncbi:autotransporter outer membrane beta-barrel domain-containing protein [Paenalcaligenes sp. Me131]|uniref:autotransporter family protein n=1 Tax=Paenalcaligenes sp. Me131 TaxID=3392636 RepID=UPI003D29E2B2